jgi:hypothetical protein
MFGYVQANLSDLSGEEQERYKAAYCGLCRTLGQRHGISSRLSLTYDLTFLTLLLSSLYEPEEQTEDFRCGVHPRRKGHFMTNSCTEYAADLTVALSYHKCLDDWNDDGNLARKCYASILEKQYPAVQTAWPEQCKAIEQGLQELSEIEQARLDDPDAGAKCFGRLMESLFLYKKDRWEGQLRALGNGLGRYIYLADAAVDLERDRHRGSYNPLVGLTATPEEFRSMLMTVLGAASQAFEELPLVQDIHLLRNILYSGIWIKYNQGMQNTQKKVKP